VQGRLTSAEQIHGDLVSYRAGQQGRNRISDVPHLGAVVPLKDEAVRKRLKASGLAGGDGTQFAVVSETAGARVPKVGGDCLGDPIPVQARIGLAVVVVGKALPFWQFLVSSALSYYAYLGEVLGGVSARAVIEDRD
jgi:hypothetical protein